MTQFLGHSDVEYGFQDTLCDMVISISVLQELVDKALAEKSGDVLESHFGDACTRPTAGMRKITLKASPKPDADMPPAAKKAKASGDSSGDCIALEPVFAVRLLCIWNPSVHQPQLPTPSVPHEGMHPSDHVHRRPEVEGLNVLPQWSAIASAVLQTSHANKDCHVSHRL